jgi:hypothetical protein
MTDMTPTPEPPPNYRILALSEYSQPLPSGAVYYSRAFGWTRSTRIGAEQQNDEVIYAVPLSPVSEPQEHNPDGLTPEQVGKGWLLLSPGTKMREGDQMWKTSHPGYPKGRWVPIWTSLYGMEVPTKRTVRRISPVAGKEEPKAERMCTFAPGGMLDWQHRCKNVARHQNRLNPAIVRCDEHMVDVIPRDWDTFAPANAAEVGPSGQPDRGAESANPGNDQQASTWFAVAKDPESYETIMCSDIVDGWKRLMFSDPEDADSEELAHFMEFKNDEDNWWHDSWGRLAVLRYEVGGESNGTITFYRVDAEQAAPSTPAQCAAKLSEGQPANAETEQECKRCSGKGEILVDLKTSKHTLLCPDCGGTTRADSQLSTLRAELKDALAERDTLKAQVEAADKIRQWMEENNFEVFNGEVSIRAWEGTEAKQRIIGTGETTWDALLAALHSPTKP